MTATETAPRTKSLTDAEFKHRLQQVRRVDDSTNWVYIGRTYLYLAVVIGAAVWACEAVVAAGAHWAWCAPILALASILVGAGQHQLAALGHEAAHHTLFKNRWLNELASDWLCMFPVFSTTHHYRLEHLAHHQFVNDPHRDPNFGQLHVNGFWTRFPISKPEFWRQLLSHLWPGYLVRYMVAQAMYNSLPNDDNPYQCKNGRMTRIAAAVGVLYLFAQLAVSYVSSRNGDAAAMAIWPTILFAAVMAFLGFIPSGWYSKSRIHPTYSMRVLSLMRVAWASAVFIGTGWLAVTFGRHVWLYTLILWIVPLGTSFSFFMMMRQLVQHSNADRGKMTNTRVFLQHPLVKHSILPFGQDYHLPHHLYATVPHYRLKELHELMMQYPEYREQVLLVNGAVLSKDEYPSIVDMLGPNYAPGERHAAHVDDSVLDQVEVTEKETILAASRQSRRED